MDIDQGGSGCPDIGKVLLGGGSIGPSIWVRDMGTDAAYEESVGKILPQGDPQAYGMAIKEGAEQRLGLPLLEDTIVVAGLQEVETYFFLRQNTVAQYIVTRPIMDLFLAAKQRPGTRVEIRWW